MTVKDKIIDLRIRSGLTQEQFAEKANIDLDRLKAVENGDLLPDEEMRVAISQAFELSAYELTPDIDEQDEYDRQSEAENTIDAQLPYNPFFREGSEGSAGAASQPVVADSRKILRKAGIYTYLAPGLLFLVMLIPSFVLIRITMHNPQLEQYNLFLLPTAVTSALSVIITLLFARSFYLRAFNKLGMKETAKKHLWLALMAINSVPSMASYSINQIMEKPSNYSQFGDLIEPGEYFAKAMPYYALSLANIIINAVVTVSVFYLLYRLLKNGQGTDNENSFFVAYLLIAICSAARFVFEIIKGNEQSIFYLIRIPVEIASVILVLYLIKNREKMNNVVLTKVIPIIVLIITAVGIFVPSVYDFVNV